MLAKLAEASSGSSAFAPSTASTRTGPLPPVPDQPTPAAAGVDESKDGADGEEDEDEEETDDPDAGRSDGGWDDEDEWVPPVAATNSVSTSADIHIASEANGTGQSMIGPPLTPFPTRTDAASPALPPRRTSAAADIPAADVVATTPAANVIAAADHTLAPAPAPADVDDDWLEAVAPSNFAPPADDDNEAFWPLGPTLLPDDTAELSPLTQPTHHPGSPDSYGDSGDELNRGAENECALCGRWMTPAKTAEHVARLCGTIPSPERARKAAKRRSMSTSTPKTRRTSTSTATPKKPRTPPNEKPIALPAARRAELDGDRWAARVDDDRGVLYSACGVWVDVGGPGLGAVQRWSGQTGHKSLCGEIVETTRREEAEARMRELRHAHEAPAPVPPEILADKRVRRIDGDQAQCDVCGVWMLLRNWDAHQGGKCEQIRARREAKAARRASAKGLDALGDLSSDSEVERKHMVYFVGGPEMKVKAASEAASGSGTVATAASASASATASTTTTSGSAAVAAPIAAAPATTAAGAKTASPAVAAPVAAVASALTSADVASASVSAPALATAPAAQGSAASALKAAAASASAPKTGTASTSATKSGTASASASASAPATKNGKASASAASPASIYLSPGAPAPTMQRMYAPGGRFETPVGKGKGKAAAPRPAPSVSTSAKPATSAKPSGSALASTSTGAKPAGPAASATGAKPSGSTPASAGAKPAPVTGKRAAGPSADAPAAKKAKVAAAPEALPPKKILPLESILSEADARAAAAAAASAAGPLTVSATKPAATTSASVSKPVAASSAAVPPSTSKAPSTAQSATPSASKPRVLHVVRKSVNRALRPFGPGTNKRVTEFSQAAKRRAASPSESEEEQAKEWSNAPLPYITPPEPPRVTQIRRPYRLCGLEADVSTDSDRTMRIQDLPTDPEQLLRYERQVILHYDADVARVAEDDRIQCKGCNSWIKLPTSGAPTKKWYGRAGHKACCPGNIERQQAAAAHPATQLPEVVFDEPFRIQKIKGNKVQCAGCHKNISAPMWARHVEQRCAVYTAATGAPKPESSDSESDAAEAPGMSNGTPRGRLNITIAKRRAHLLERTAVRGIGEARLLCDLCGRWVKISKHLHAHHENRSEIKRAL